MGWISDWLEAGRQRRAERQNARARVEQRLIKAAGVSQVDMYCHADTWQWIARWVELQGSPSPQLASEDTPDFVVIPLSGPNLVRILSRTRYMQSWIQNVERAMAYRVYDAVAGVVDQIEFEAGDGKAPPDIVMDARVRPNDDDRGTG